MMRKAIFRSDEIRLVARFDPSMSPLSFGDRVQLNSGGPLGLVVDVVGDALLVIAWRESATISESVLPRPCLRRLPL